jgi:hypothetical protein
MEAAAAKEEALVASVAAAAAAKEAGAAAATAMEAAAVLKAKGEAAVAANAGEAAARASKKPKFHAIDDQEDDPPGSGTVNDQDLISCLPDDLLGSIVSLLPTNEGIRTQAISRRWRPLWRSSPLNLASEDVFMSKGYTKSIDLIPKILSEHPCPARRCSLWIFAADEIGRLLPSQALDNLQELELTCNFLFAELTFLFADTFYVLPSSAFRFAPTLLVAKFRSCNFPNFIAPRFLCLKQLTLDSVTISGDVLQGMISGSPALESLELKDNLGIARLCISSQTLKSLGFCAGQGSGGVFLQELVIEDTPCLERLLPLDPKHGSPTIRIVSAPKLKILGMLSKDIAELRFGTMVFQVADGFVRCSFSIPICRLLFLSVLVLYLCRK